MSMELTKKELANAAGYTYRRLYDIDRALPEGKKLFVEGEGGKYDLATFVQRWVEYNMSLNAGDMLEDLDTVKARHEVIKTQKTELEVQRMRGQLIDVQEARKLWGDIVNTATQNLIHVPSKVAPLVKMMDNVEEIAQIMDTEIRAALTAIAETPLPEYAQEDGDEEADEEA